VMVDPVFHLWLKFQRNNKQNYDCINGPLYIYCIVVSSINGPLKIYYMVVSCINGPLKIYYMVVYCINGPL
jgi:hypothetical protein